MNKVGVPSGVTVAPEGGAHQSIKTPSIGLEQPGCVTYEPAFALEWAIGPLLPGSRPQSAVSGTRRPAVIP